MPALLTNQMTRIFRYIKELFVFERDSTILLHCVKNQQPYTLRPAYSGEIDQDQPESKHISTGLELKILKGTHFKAILKGKLRAPRPLHVKE